MKIEKPHLTITMSESKAKKLRLEIIKMFKTDKKVNKENYPTMYEFGMHFLKT